MLLLSGRLYFSTGRGIFVGHGEWTRIYDGLVGWMRVSASEKSILFTEEVVTQMGGGHSGHSWRSGRLDPATGEVVYGHFGDELGKRVAPGGYWFDAERGTISDHARRYGGRNLVRIPDREGTSYALGPFRTGSREMLVTGRAVWIVSEGDLVRIDTSAFAGLPTSSGE